MTRRRMQQTGARGPRSVAKNQPAQRRTAPPGRRATRAGTFAQWALAGALAGIILSVTQQQDPWAGTTLLSNIAQAAGAGLATGLVALGACWIWLARQA